MKRILFLLSTVLLSVSAGLSFADSCLNYVPTCSANHWQAPSGWKIISAPSTCSQITLDSVLVNTGQRYLQCNWRNADGGKWNTTIGFPNYLGTIGGQWNANDLCAYKESTSPCQWNGY